MDHFDIILLYQNNRRHAYYLNIVKAMGQKYRVGILVDPSTSKYAHKQKETDNLFMRKLMDHGAVLVKDPCSCHILMVAVVKYSDECFKMLNDNFVSYKKVVGYLRFSFSPMHLEELKRHLSLKTILSEDIELLHLHLKHFGQEDLLDGMDIHRTTFIYSRYPVFEKDFNLDYLIVFPTKMSFQSEIGSLVDPYEKARFMRNVNRLLANISAHDKVAYKLHSVLDGGWPFASTRIEHVLEHFPLQGTALINRIITNTGIDRLHPRIAEIPNTGEFVAMKKQCQNFTEITPCYNFPVELFYPNIRKGIITGRSNAVWGALKADVPVYNCDDNSSESVFGNFFYHLKVNNNYFGVPPCRGDLVFDPANFEKVRQNDSIDPVEFMEHTINSS